MEVQMDHSDDEDEGREAQLRSTKDLPGRARRAAEGLQARLGKADLKERWSLESELGSSSTPGRTV